MNEKINEFIICSAIQIVDTKKIYYGHRHNHCLTAMNGELSWEMNRQQLTQVENVQGFITNWNRFVTREDALIIALANGQVLNKEQVRGNQLFSEDLY